MVNRGRAAHARPWCEDLKGLFPTMQMGVPIWTVVSGY